MNTVWIVTVHNKLKTQQPLLDFRIFRSFAAANKYYRDTEDRERMPYISEEYLYGVGEDN